jgi:hypothetical protein
MTTGAWTRRTSGFFVCRVAIRIGELSRELEKAPTRITSDRPDVIGKYETLKQAGIPGEHGERLVVVVIANNG